MKYELETKTAIHCYSGRIATDRYLRDRIFEMIERIAGTEEAMAATSWAEIADPGETYEHELFTLTIKD